MTPDSPAPPPPAELPAAPVPLSPAKMTLAALGILALGVVICWFAIWDPLQDARKGVRTVSYSLKGAFLGPVVLVMGLVTLFLRTALGFGPGQKPTVMGWLVIVLAVAAGGVTAWWFNGELARLGYSRR